MYIKPAIHWCYIYIARPQLSTAAKLVFRGNSVRQTLCGDLSIRTNHHKCSGPTLINDISTNRWLRDPKHYDDDDLITYKHIECVLFFILLHKGIVMEIYHWVFKLDASPSLDRTKGPSVLLGYFFRCPTHIYWPFGIFGWCGGGFCPSPNISLSEYQRANSYCSGVHRRVHYWPWLRKWIFTTKAGIYLAF